MITETRLLDAGSIPRTATIVRRFFFEPVRYIPVKKIANEIAK